MLPAEISSNEEMPQSEMQAQPLNLQTLFLGTLTLLAVLTALYVGRDIALPVVFAFVLKLVLQPALRLATEKLHIPRPPAAMLILLMFFGLLFGLGEILAEPASIWAQKLPEAMSTIKERISPISKPFQETQALMLHAEDMAHTSGPKVMPVAIQGNRLFDKVFDSTRAFIGETATTIVLLFFFMVSGDTFLRRLVEILPRFKDKRRAVDISQQVEHDIAHYLFTISVMNAIVGIATGLVAFFTGLGDPMLWGTLAFMLNYIPILGPIVMGAVYFIASMIVLPDNSAFAPVICYYVIHTMESTFITPMLLAQRFTLNPVLVVLALIFWYWMWGFPGAILSTPMLAILKIICDRIHRLKAFGHFLEGNPPSSERNV